MTVIVKQIQGKFIIHYTVNINNQIISITVRKIVLKIVAVSKF